MKRVFAIWVAVMVAVASTVTSASFHLFEIQQIYSNADGSVQFIVLTTDTNREHLWSGHALESTGAGPTRTFVFPTDLPSNATAGKSVLIATEGFAALGLVTPDYVIPNGFLHIPNGTVDFAGVSQLAYTGLPNDSGRAIDRFGNPMQNLATNFAGASAWVPASAGSPGVLNYQGMWYAAPAESEAGWGINFAHQGDAIFATWFTHDANGQAWFLTMSAFQTGPKTFAGELVRTSGPPFSAVPFSGPIQAIPVGSATLTFTDASNGTFAYAVNGVSQTKAITKQVFGVLPTCTWNGPSSLAAATNYQDLWWALGGAESGWGINFAHQSDAIFATWFTYDMSRNPLQMSATLFKKGPTTYSGDLIKTSGPPFSASPWNPGAVDRIPAGTATVTFANGNRATFRYTVALAGQMSAVTQSKEIERQVFRPPGTVCQ